MKVNNYPLKTPTVGDKVFGSDSNGNQVQFDAAILNPNIIKTYEYEIGEYVPSEGGVIFHRYLDGGNQKYLAVSIVNQSDFQVWSNVSSTEVGSGAQSTWNGLSNSNAIVSQAGHTTSAAAICLSLQLGGKSDWYLPSMDELRLLYDNRFNVNRTLSGASSYGIIGGSQILDNGDYWSSTEFDASSSYFFFFSRGYAFGRQKNELQRVRAIRAFQK